MNVQKKNSCRMVYTRGLILARASKKSLNFVRNMSNPLLLILNENHVLKYFGFLYEHFKVIPRLMAYLNEIFT